MTEGKLEFSCAEQMEHAALFSADLIGPLANSLDARNPLAMHRNAGTELATKLCKRSQTCLHATPRRTSQIVSVIEIENLRDPILFVDVHE
jgi:hypothetical protein